MQTIAFIMLCVFWFLLIGRTIMLMLRGVRVFVLAKGKTLAGRLLELILIPALVLWSLQVAFAAFDTPLIPVALFWDVLFIQIIGAILCFVGLIIFLLALIAFGNAWRIGIDETHSNRLVTHGIFAVSRNPIFLFMDLYFVGTFLIFPNWFFLLFCICAAISIHRQILNEEYFLLNRFGVKYDEYTRKVRRYF